MQVCADWTSAHNGMMAMCVANCVTQAYIDVWCIGVGGIASKQCK